MTDIIGPIGDGHTALDDDNRRGLLPSYISTRGELNRAEQQNIAAALLSRRGPKTASLLDDGYLRGLHKAMFGEVWKWAGAYRKRETNIGFDPKDIAPAVRQLVDDAKAWVEFASYERDELAIRFHHRLVAIHPFPNGNGRFGRVAADYLVQSLGGSAFTWGSNRTVSTEELREAYLGTLRAADAGDVGPLLAFARS